MEELGKLPKWYNKKDSSRGLIGMSISPNLQFHLQGIDSPIEAWEKLNTILDMKNEI